MKKIILGLGSAAVVVAPIATVISCSAKKEEKHAIAKLEQSKIIVATPAQVEIASTEPAYDGATWSFTAPSYDAPGSILQYTIDGTTWFDLLPLGETVRDIADGATANFKWVLEDEYSTSWLETPTAPSPIHYDSSVAGVAAPTNPSVTSHLPSYNGATWTFTVPAYNATNAKLQYKVEGGSWTDVTTSEVTVVYGKTVTFQWALTNPNSVWVAGQAPAAPTSIVGTSQNTGVTPPASNPAITHTDPAYNGATWSFTVPAYSLNGAKLQYKIKEDGADWIDAGTSEVTVPYGKTVTFQWVLDADHVWIGSAPSAPSDLAPTSNKTGVAAPSAPTITHTDPAYNGASWTFTVTSAVSPTGAKLQYQIDEGTWTNATTSAVTVAYGKSVHFKWKLLDESNSVWIGGSEPTTTVLPSPTSTKQPVVPLGQNPLITPTNPTYNGATWSFNVAKYTLVGAKIQYSLDNGKIWNDIPAGGVSNIPYTTTVQFKWTLTSSDNYAWANGMAPQIPSLSVIPTSVIGVAAPSTMPTITTHANTSNWSFDATNFTILNSAKLQYTVDGKAKDVQATGNVVPYGKTPTFSWVLLDPTKSVWIDKSALAAKTPTVTAPDQPTNHESEKTHLPSVEE